MVDRKLVETGTILTCAAEVSVLGLSYVQVARDDRVRSLFDFLLASELFDEGK